ncbi:O-antigen ligase family protein [Methylobacterium aquaticum]|uniref:Polymerase n=1 Tax=Methylobacterium aquaticum TaxID=270351 RepID=A0A0J6S9N3_9HYPH|nr:O-antigen ligase family protein [Methylobacterium aquaticum]KMO30397.1 polymerase [Methylobacterium aquaticum]
MATFVLPRRDLAAVPFLHLLRGFGHVLMAAFIFFACFAFSDTSPYDIVAIPTIVLWVLLGVRLYRGAIPVVIILLAFVAATVVALIPYLDEDLPAVWTVQLGYLAVTGIFFTLFFSDDSDRRVEAALKVYTASTLFCAILGIGGYLELIGNEKLFSMYGRASGTFQDPNVFGSFLTLGALYLMHNLLTGRARRPLLSGLGLFILLAGVFLSFSRGSWGGTLVVSGLMVLMLYRTSAPRLRRRIVLLAALTAGFGAVALVGLLSVGSVGETFAKRAAVTQDYDEGETGRFGNQLRGIGMLIEDPLGMGPLRWRRTFNLEPHNSYIGAFSNGGWIGGVTFVFLVLMTSRVGFRLMSQDTPYRRHAQIVFPALLMFFLQAVQIDIEKWRHVYMMLGIVWGLEAARVRWLATREA